MMFCQVIPVYYRSMIFCQAMYRFPILLDASAAALKRKGDKFLAKWADIMTGEYTLNKYLCHEMMKSNPNYMSVNICNHDHSYEIEYRYHLMSI